MRVALRYIEMFRVIPQGIERAISTQKILNILQNDMRHEDLQERTVQRDLINASNNFFNLKSYSIGNQNLWYWESAMQFPAMLEEEAIALKLNEMFIASLLPSTATQLANYFHQADQCLMNKKGNNDWMKKITVALPSNDYFTNAFKQIDSVFNAIIKNVEFHAYYRNQKRKFNPQGLIFEIGSGLLITAFSKDDSYTSEHHNIYDINILELYDVELTNDYASVVFNFDLQAYIDEKYPSVEHRKIGFVK
jgi:hypothetical protein